jgi:hypothetical protein
MQSKQQLRAALAANPLAEIGFHKMKAYRFPKGTSGNAGRLTKPYFEARRLARAASPEVMKEMIRLALEASDERVRSVCAVAVLDRAGVKPIDFDPNEGKDQRLKFNPDDYSAEELEVIEQAFRLMVERERALKAAALPAPEAVAEAADVDEPIDIRCESNPEAAPQAAPRRRRGRPRKIAALVGEIIPPKK